METKASAVSSPTQTEHDTAADGKRPPPLLAKIFAQLHVSNTQFSLLEASEDFMATVLLLISGVITDRVGGAEMIIYGNVIYTIGSILVAAATTVRSFNFMIGGRVILALGDIATHRPIGGFVGKFTANVIAKKTGNFAWVFWTSVFMNLFTNAATVIFWFFNRYCNVHYRGRQDTATKEVLTEKNKKFELQKMFQLPWMFWTVMAFSLFQTSTASVFSQNATELAERRFNVDSITAGWYRALSQYAGFFLVPCLGVFIDVLGNRASVLCVCGIGMFLSMVLVNFAETRSGTAASFGIYAIAVSLGPTSIIDSIRTTLWHQSVFGSAYALKVTMNNAMNIIIRIITGALQDADDDSYRRVVRVYLFLAAASVVVGLAILLAALMTDSLAPLQWTRRQRLTLGPEHIRMIRERHTVTCYARNKLISIYCFSALLLLTVGGWVAYIWGAVTGNNS
ncbi:hypothetical protein KXW98_000956 [Aspergillus fumigatus]|nr:hypothetical protein KXX10_001348 [Aspergillus fumigatus]KAH1548967.1 hypothetical protein KXX37_001538 [Aspergillus fumigatus]KAH1745955.1 hypothetical protein KXX41_001351 [Aspergillus fumigatus]KAH2012707.1 hypothetical protein KXV45_006771 [Aspergillus fumigatus]KAH2367353.1 hypothetical protein KXV41_001387 [Aspergillus fumigatus]